jgi:sulfate permease, SulP family
MLKAWLVDSRSRVSRWDYLTVAGMVLATALFGFLPAVCIGLLACCVDFAVSSARLPPVRRLLPRSAWPAKAERGPQQSQMLLEAGSGMRIIELQGVLFFGSVTRLVDELDELLSGNAPPRRLLLDFQRVPWVDSSAGQALVKLQKLAQRAGTAVHFSGLAPHARQVLESAGCLPPAGPQPHADIDEAVRAWDDEVLRQADPAQHRLEDWLIDELGGGERATQALAHFETLQLAPGDILFSEGDASDALYFVGEGRLIASVGQGAQRAVVRALHAGSAVGEMGLFREAVRSATLRAVEPSRVLRLRREKLRALEGCQPQLALALHRLLIRQLAGRLEQASAQASALSR